MLLYTRLAPPKEPKRRSRGGCIHCKEKKKKCDENRPKCGRCDENGVECIYAAVKPRQRKRRDSLRLGVLTAGAPSAEYSASRRLSEASCFSDDSSYYVWRDNDHNRAFSNDIDETAIFSPCEPTFPGFANVDFASVNALSGYSESDDVEPSVEDIIEEEAAADQDATSTTNSIISRLKSSSPDRALIDHVRFESPLFEFTAPAFSEFSERPNRRALVDHFCNVLSHLIVFREETGNPFQQLILPLTRKSAPVMNAIFALACAHLEYRGVSNSERALYFHNRAIQGVAQLIQQNDKINRNEALAAIMLLVYYECLVQKGHSNIVAGHLKGFLTIMSSTTPDPSDSATIFLERAFRFYDVITALSNGTAPLSDPPTPNCLLPLSPLGAPTTSPLCSVDTLLGMSTTLWPIIHRLSGLSALKSELRKQGQHASSSSSCSSSTKLAVLQSEFSSTAQAIERALNEWTPVLPKGFDPYRPTNNSNVHSIYHNSLAYRHGSLVYLYRTVLGYERRHELVQKHVKLTLEHCKCTVEHRGPMSALLWPLFVAACEAVEGSGDREVAETVFAEVEGRQGMRNIGEAWEVVKGVWARDKGVGGKQENEGAEEQGGGDELGEGVGDEEEDDDVVVIKQGEGVKEKEQDEEEDEEDEEDEEEEERSGEVWRTVARGMGVSIVFG